MRGVLKEVSMFFEFSPKQQSKFEEVAAEEDADNRTKKLVGLCRTRWVARHTSLAVFRQLYSVVTTTLSAIAFEDGWNAESASKASFLLASVTSFLFIVAFVITWRLLEYCQVSFHFFEFNHIIVFLCLLGVRLVTDFS